MSELEALDDDLRELFSREKDAYVENVAARDAVLRRLQMALVLGPAAAGGVAAASAGAGAGAGASGSAGAKTAGIAALGWKGAALIGTIAFGAGLGVGEAHRALSPSSTPAEAPTMTGTAAVAPVPSVTASETTPTITLSSLPNTPAAPSATATVTTTPAAAAPSPADVQAERMLIDTARTALGRGMAADALTATETHAKRFPHGRLAEEREVLAIQALVAKGDVAAARARASRFHKMFPDSMFRATVDNAIGEK